MSRYMVLKPRLSEKTYALSRAKNVYVFEVPIDANKHAVADAVARQFNVSVENARTLIVKGKPKRTVKGRGRVTAGRRSNTKKAYVSLKEGDNIPVFTAEEEQQAKETKQ